MFTTINATLFQAVAIATVSVLATGSGMRQDDSNQAGIIVTYSKKSPIQLSMGPDPGGKTGATVTPETTKTGQPTDEPSNNQPGASTAARASGTRDSTDASKGPTNSSEPLKARDSTETRPTRTSPTAPSTSGQDR